MTNFFYYLKILKIYELKNLWLKKITVKLPKKQRKVWEGMEMQRRDEEGAILKEWGAHWEKPKREDVLANGALSVTSCAGLAECNVGVLGARINMTTIINICYYFMWSAFYFVLFL